ncbi:fluoride efflux transporter FluC [Salibaculum griseiflavum]|uniref:Fluoride-specific ion channel FluC n=1 Tax=Salibaculum griseiflavum TaxID=1914409 RepID=A0A2V1PA91_9RHOB|nr:CrcB family protein [Salibaculum griseiflavum]PWG18584.1 fluoride efflux transporter CrcB [Salibaculum griseiflavum]
MLITMLQVALGGAIGSAARFAAGVAIARGFGAGGFPLGVLTVNILGSFLMGAFVVFLGQRGLTALNPFLMTGLLGGFTTFSAFSLETLTLVERGALGQAGLYVGLSVAGSLLAIAAGVCAMRSVLA